MALLPPSRLRWDPGQETPSALYKEALSLTELKQTQTANEVMIEGRSATLTGLSDFVNCPRAFAEKREAHWSTAPPPETSEDQR